jgi:protein TonB
MIPIEDSVVDVSPDSNVTKGEPDTTPRSDEVVVFDATDRFEQMAAPVSPHEIVSTSTISFGPIGHPDGIGIPSAAPVGITALDNPPRTRSQVAPVYPNEVKVEGKGGEVLIEFIVDETGRVLDAHVVKSSDPRFESATLRAVAKWRFEPGKSNGRPVRFRMVAPVVFSLEA